jgi:hypothetical protein
MSGFQDAQRFLPERWEGLKERDTNYLPFGAHKNRPCPGKRLSLVWTRAVTRVMIEKVDIVSFAEHTRSLPDGGYCLMTPRNASNASNAAAGDAGGTGGECTSTSTVRAPSVVVSVLTLATKLRNTLEPAYISAKQFVNEISMLRESEKLQLAQKYYSDYSAHDSDENPDKPCLSNQLMRTRAAPG